jgi:hypothetical protein
VFVFMFMWPAEGIFQLFQLHLSLHCVGALLSCEYASSVLWVLLLKGSWDALVAHCIADL